MISFQCITKQLYQLFKLHASKPKSKKMISNVHTYACSLIEIWQILFGNGHVMTRNDVTYKINEVVDH